jgi:hypothetical protein
MMNKMWYLDNYMQVLWKTVLIILIIIFINNVSTSQLDEFVPIQVDLEVIDLVSDAGDTSLIKSIYNQSGIVIWRPDVRNVTAYAMLNKNNNQISVSLIGTDADLSSFLMPSQFEVQDIIFGELNKKTDLYELLRDVSNDTGLKLKGTPSYLSNNHNHSDFTIKICLPVYCRDLPGAELLNIDIKDYLFIPGFTIYNLTPENNSVLNRDQVEVTWQTELPSSSVVTIWEDGNNTPEIIDGPDNVVYHRVVKDNLSCGSSYRYDVTSSISNTSRTASVTEKGRRLKTPFTIFNLKPEHNAVINRDQVEFTWQTGCPSSSVVTIWEDGNNTPEIIEGPDDVVFHRVVKDNMSCGRSYTYDVTSSISNRSATEKGRRLKIGECGIRFISKPYNFIVERDYNQICTLKFKNYGSKVRNITVEVSNTTSDLITGFLETGTPNESIRLDPFKEGERKFIVHAQDAMKEQYNLTAYIYDLDDNSRVLDTAQVTINIDFRPAFTITEIYSDPETLVKTIRINNLGDTLTDLQVRSYPESRISLHPQFNHFNLLSGQSMEFYAIPLFSQDGRSIEGNITATSGNMSESLPVNFTCLEGKHIFKKTLNYPQFTIVKDDYYCTNRPDISMPFLMPPGFNASDVLNAKMQIDFIPKSPMDQYSLHNITISLNDRIVDKIVGVVVPNDTYSYDLSGSDFNYALPEVGTPGYNTIRLNTEHLNRAHYIVSGKVTLRLCLKKLERWICASSEEEAEQILWKTPGIKPVSENLYVNIINPPEGENVTVNNATTIIVSVNGSIGGFKTPENNLEVFAKIENASNVYLYDDGRHNDSFENDGIYGGAWTPTEEGRVNISVNALNCKDSGEDDTWVWVDIPKPFDLAVSEIDIVKSSGKPGKADVIVTLSNIGEGPAPSFRANLSVGDRENVKEDWRNGLASGQSMLLNWTLDENELCGKEIRVCIKAEVPENIKTNNCLNISYCLKCGDYNPNNYASDLIVLDIEPKYAQVDEPLEISFTAKNIGQEDALGPFAAELKIDGTLYGGKEMMDGLASGESKDGTFNISGLPVGNYTLSICIDVENAVNESNEGNNCHSEPLEINDSLTSDLIVSDIEPKYAQVDKPLEISFTAKNIGQKDAVGPFAAELRIDGTLYGGKEMMDGLASGESKDGTFNISGLPVGNYTLSICIDVENAVNESDEGNNCHSEPLEINDSLTSDLIVSDIEPKYAQVDEPLEISFTAKNIGQKDAVGSFAAELRIDGKIYGGKEMMDGLASGERKDGTFNISGLPVGNYTLSICIDVDNVVKENNDGNNCALSYIKIDDCNKCNCDQIIIITNPGPEVFNYPVWVQMPIVRSDKLRFVDEQENELYYWVEEGSETSSTIKVWINAARIHTGENKICAFTNSMSLNHQDPKKVFSFFDDFQTLNESQWIYPSWGPGTRLNGSLIQEMGKIKLIKNSSIESQRMFLQSRNEFPSGQAAIFRTDLGTSQSWATQSLGFTKNHDPKTRPSLCWVADGKDITYFSDTGAKTIENNFDSGYRTFEIRRQNDGIIFGMDGSVFKTSSTNSIGIPMPIEFAIQSEIIDGSSEMILDWVAVRDCRNGDLKAELVDTARI